MQNKPDDFPPKEYPLTPEGFAQFKADRECVSPEEHAKWVEFAARTIALEGEQSRFLDEPCNCGCGRTWPAEMHGPDCQVHIAWLADFNAAANAVGDAMEGDDAD